MSKPFQLGWHRENHSFGGDIGLAEHVLTSSEQIDQEWAREGYVTTTLYPNDMFFILFHKTKPAKMYFGSANASVFEVTGGELTTLYSRENPA